MLPLLRTSLVACLLAVIADAQCTTNLVTNGDFSQLLPLWSKVGTVSMTFPNANVDGVGASRCVSLTGATGTFTLNAPGTLGLAAGNYEFSMDVLWSGWNTTFAINLVNGGTPVTVATRALPLVSSGGRVRVASMFSVAAGGNPALQLGITTANSSGVIQIDNIAVHQAQLPLFNFDQVARRVGINNGWTVTAEPNDVLAIAVGLNPLPGPLPIPNCQGMLWLLTPAVVVNLAAVSPGGDLSGSLVVPGVVRGFPLWWQAVGFTQTSACYLGCADMIAF